MAARQFFRRVRPLIPSLSSLSTSRQSRIVTTALFLGATVGVAETASAEGQTTTTTDSKEVLDRARDVLRQYYEKKAEEIGVDLGSKRRKVNAGEFFHDFNATGDVCVDYLLVGGGTATYGALAAILRRDPMATVLVVTEEDMYPYNRTPLSKEVWRDSFGGVQELEYGYRVSNGQGKGVSIAKRVSVESLDAEKKTVKLSTGIQIEFQKLLLATGGKPRLSEAIGPGLVDSPLVSTLRNVDDYRALKRVTDQAKHCTVVGAGFLGTELAVALNGSGVRTTLVCPEPGALYKILPRYASELVSRKMREAGVDLHVSTAVGNLKSEEHKSDAMEITSTKPNAGSIKLGVFGPEDRSMLTERVVVCAGIDPRVELAREAGLEIDERNGGIRVDRGMRADEDIYAAGDVASYWDRTLGRRRVEHWDHALTSGKIAGENMVGSKNGKSRKRPSQHALLSMYWCDLSPVGINIEAVGMTDSNLSTVGVWNMKEKSEEVVKGALSSYNLESGVIWYLKDETIVGALLWNTCGKKNLSLIREVISSKKKLTPEQLRNAIPLAEQQESLVIRIPGVRPGL